MKKMLKLLNVLEILELLGFAFGLCCAALWCVGVVAECVGLFEAA